MPVFAKARSFLRNLFLARRVEAELDDQRKSWIPGRSSAGHEAAAEFARSDRDWACEEKIGSAKIAERKALLGNRICGDLDAHWSQRS